MDWDTLVTVQHQLINPKSIVWMRNETRSRLCQMSYPDHPSGCINYGTRHSCPPQVEYGKLIAFRYGFHYLVYARFDFRQYKEIRRPLFPDWSERQLGNPRHWQNSVKRILKDAVIALIGDRDRKKVIAWGSGSGIMGLNNHSIGSMEAVGIYVFSTLKRNGIPFELKPHTFITLVALVMADVSLEENTKKITKTQTLEKWM